MAVIGNLETLVTAKTAPFEKSMRKAQKTTQGFTKSLKGASFGLGGLATGLSVGIVTSELKSTLDELDAIGKSAARIGETTEEISRLQFAAKISGVESEKLTGALEVMTKRLGEAAQGSGEAKAALESMGLSAEELINKRPAEAFRDIAEAISKLDTQAEKAANTSDIFSRANLDLVNTLDLGRKGLAEMAAESDKLGNTVDQKLVKSAEEANDAITRLGAIFDGFKRQAAGEIAPILSDLTDGFTGLATAVGKVSEAVGIDLAPGGGTSVFGALKRQLGIVGIAGRGLAASIKGDRAAEAEARSDLLKSIGGGLTDIGLGGLVRGTSFDPAKEQQTQEEQLGTLQSIERILAGESAPIGPQIDSLL